MKSRSRNYVTIHLDQIGSIIIADTDEENVYHILSDALSQNLDVIVSCNNVKAMSVKFACRTFGHAYTAFGSRAYSEHVTFKNASKYLSSIIIEGIKQALDKETDMLPMPAVNEKAPIICVHEKAWRAAMKEYRGGVITPKINCNCQ